jgi:dihydrofolate reductase
MIRLIVAMDQRRGIAKNGYRPWSLPEDMAYFAKQTKSHGGNVLVGGITFRNDIKGKPLADRTTYLLTRDSKPIEGVRLVHDLDAWLAGLQQDVWILGGASVYQQIMERGKVDELYVTHINADLGCDQFFPEYAAKFHLQSQSDLRSQNGFDFTHAVYTRQ